MNGLYNKVANREEKISLIGLGYVGMPIAVAFSKKADVIGFVNKNNVPVVKSPCPADGNTKREYVHNLLKQLNHENPGVKMRMFTAIQTGNLKGWTDIIGKSKLS